jgi:pimeloyl-ACP methyl ester carboxylesterase
MALYGEVASLDSSMVKPWIRLATSADLSAAAAALQPPTLAVLAERSWPKGEPWSETARALGYDRIPRLEPLRIEGCGHFVMLDRPVELADAIARFAATPDRAPIAAR